MAPTQHKVVIYHQPGASSVLQVEEQPVPRRADGEVLIKQYSSSVNPVDWKMRQVNKEHLPKECPMELGCSDCMRMGGEMYIVYADSRRRYSRSSYRGWEW